MYKKSITFITSKDLPYWLRVSVVALFIGTSLYIIFNYTLIQVTVTYHDNIPPTATIYASGEKSPSKKTIQVANYAIVKRDTSSISVSAGTYTTTKETSVLPLLGIKNITLGVYKDKNVSKYSGDNIGCTAYDKAANVLMSYVCGKPGNLVRYDRPSDPTQKWENKLITSLTSPYGSIYTISPFKDGLLGLNIPGVETPEKDAMPLFYVNSSGKKQSYDLPDDFSIDTPLGEVSIVTDNTSHNSSSFLLVAKYGDVYFGTLSDSGIKYKKISLPENYISQFDNLYCSLVASKTYCYYGKGSESPDSSAATTYRQKNKSGNLISVDFSSDNPALKQYVLDSTNISIDKLYATREGLLYTLVDDRLYSFEIKEDTVNRRLFTENVSSIGNGDGLYYIKENALYKLNYTDKESYLVFKSDHIRLSNVAIFGDDVFINGFINGKSNKKLHTFKLTTSNTDNTKPRLVDILPLPLSEEVLDMDYSDNTIRARVFSPITINKSTDTITYDDGIFATNKQTVLDQLARVGITHDNYTIILSH